MARSLAALLVGLCAVSLGCAERDLEGEPTMDAEPEHPAEMLEQHERGCEAWCELQAECEREEFSCSCATRSFDDEHVLCVEKAVLALECKVALSCDEVEILFSPSTPAQDERCFGERFAETVACYRD